MFYMIEYIVNKVNKKLIITNFDDFYVTILDTFNRDWTCEFMCQPAVIVINYNVSIQCFRLLY